MPTDAQTEYERVRTKYAPARPRELVIFAMVIGGLFVASILHLVDWAFVVGGMVMFVSWEFTKFRLRRNARAYANKL